MATRSSWPPTRSRMSEMEVPEPFVVGERECTASRWKSRTDATMARLSSTVVVVVVVLTVEAAVAELLPALLLPALLLPSLLLPASVLPSAWNESEVQMARGTRLTRAGLPISTLWSLAVHGAGWAEHSSSLLTLRVKELAAGTRMEHRARVRAAGGLDVWWLGCVSRRDSVGSVVALVVGSADLWQGSLCALPPPSAHVCAWVRLRAA